MRSRIGALRMHATHDTKAVSKAGRDAANARFLDQVDPDRVLPEAERQRRADLARRAGMTSIAYKSARKRSQRASAAQLGEAA